MKSRLFFFPLPTVAAVTLPQECQGWTREIRGDPARDQEKWDPKGQDLGGSSRSTPMKISMVGLGLKKREVEQMGTSYVGIIS